MKVNTVNATKIEFGFGTGLNNIHCPISADQLEYAMQVITEKAIILYGGFTLLRTQGGWKSPTEVEYKEDGATLFVLTGHPERQSLITMVDTIKTALKQQAVCVTQTPVNFEIH